MTLYTYEELMAIEGARALRDPRSGLIDTITVNGEWYRGVTLDSNTKRPIYIGYIKV